MTDDNTKKVLKEMIKKVSSDMDKKQLKDIKNQFKETLKKTNPLLIAQAEGELLAEGCKMEDIMKACDVHLEIFKDVIRNPDLKVPDGHPIKSFQEDHKNILDLMEKLINEIKQLKLYNNINEANETLGKIKKIANKLMDAENHNVRQENTLFPVLEKNGIEHPPAIMWHEHTQMKEQKKELLKLLNEKEKFIYNDFVTKLEVIARYLLEKFASHTKKEENILYVTALKVINDKEWKEIKQECDLLGYFKP